MSIGDPAMEITGLLVPAQVLINRHASDKSRLFDELARWAAADLRLPSETILSALLKREELGSTGAGKGVALPHARLSGIGKPFVLIARLNKAIEFNAIDGVPVDIVCLVLLPEGSEEGPHAPACLARVLRDEDVLRNFRHAANHIEAYRALLRADDVIE